MLIVYSVYGPEYFCAGAQENIRLAREFYPEFRVRVYADIPAEWMGMLDGAEVIRMRQRAAADGMFWRFLAADSDEVCLFRDADSRLSLRERLAVDEWLASDRSLHIMRDHPYHTKRILGGMWGARHGVMRGIRKAMRWYPKDAYGDDERFLEDWAYPRTAALEHSAYGVAFQNPIRAFPSDRIGQEYVGEPFRATGK